MKQIEEQLKNLKSARQEINPSPEWILKSREKLFSQIRNSIGQTPEPVSFVFSFQSFLKFFVPPQAYHVMKVASVFVFAIGITVGGWIECFSQLSSWRLLLQCKTCSRKNPGCHGLCDW
jgi:hypothetical protein